MMHNRTEQSPNRKNLSYRIIAAIMLGMGLLVTLMIVVFSYSFQVLEDDLMKAHNAAELERSKEELRKNPDFVLPQTAKLRIYRGNPGRTNMPEFLARLPAGFNSEISHQGDHYYVLVSRFDNQNLYVVNDISDFEASEHTFGIIILSAWSIIIVLIFVLSYLLSHYLIKPISTFADDVDRLQPEQRGLRFSGRYSGLEVEKMARSVDRYLDKMDEYVERQHSFAAMASHELRTPLTVIQTSSELIAAQSDEPAIREQCGKISRASSKMNDMILALLSITRDQPRDRQESQEVVLHDSVQEAIQNHQHEIGVNSIKVINWVKPEVRFCCNSTLLSVVINNLLANAIRHNPQGIIRISFMDDGLSIIDNGEGLGTENIERLFQRGVAGKNNGGYGLGLYITKLICDQQGWSLNLQPANPGTQARVEFA